MISIFIILSLLMGLGIYPVPDVGAQGRQLSGVEVNMFDPNVGSGYSNTSVGGVASFYVFQGDPIDFSVSAFGYLPVNVSIPSAQDGMSIDVTLEQSPLLEGYVFTPDGRPVVGAWVSVGGRTVYTDNNGYYAIYVGEPLGSNIQVSVSAPLNFITSLEALRQLAFFAGREIPNGFIAIRHLENYNVISKTVNVNMDSMRKMYNITLDWSAAVGGTVTFTDGSPVEGATVSFIGGLGSTSLGTSNVTDSNGNYIVNRDLSNGAYNVSVAYKGVFFSNVRSNYQVTCAPPCMSPQNLDLQIPRVGKVVGRVLSRNNRPIPQIFVRAFSNDFTVFSSGVYNESDGTFEIYLPVGIQMNLLISLSLALQIYNQSITLSSSDLPVLDLGTIVGDVNVFYIQGRITNMDTVPEPIDVVAVGQVVGLPIPITPTFSASPNPDGSFMIPVVQNVSYAGFPITLSYSVEVSSAYIFSNPYLLANPGQVNQDTDLGDMSLPPLNLVRVYVNVFTNASPDSFMAKPQSYTFALLTDTGKYFLDISEVEIVGGTQMDYGIPLVVWGGFLGFGSPQVLTQGMDGGYTVLQAGGGNGFLALMGFTVAGESPEFMLKVPKAVMDTPFTVNYNFNIPGSYQVVEEGPDYVKILVSSSAPESESQDFIVTIESPSVIDEFQWLIIIPVIATFIYIVLRRRV